MWRSDTALLATLPQGTAKLATLTVTEIMGRRKAAPRQGGDASGEPPTKKPRDELVGCKETGASEHVHGVPVTSGTAQEGPPNETALGAELFSDDTGSDGALIEWLRARETQPRCGVLLQQIREWTGHHDQNAV